MAKIRKAIVAGLTAGLATAAVAWQGDSRIDAGEVGTIVASIVTASLAVFFVRNRTDTATVSKDVS